MTTAARDLGDMSIEDIHQEANALIEKIRFDFEEVEWEIEKTIGSLRFIDWELCILGHVN
jgi:hypothetical protein